MNEAKRARYFEKGWKYTLANETDVAKTFARVRKAMKEEEAKTETRKVLAKPLRMGPQVRVREEK